MVAILNLPLIVESPDDFMGILFLEFLVELQHELLAKQGILYQQVDNLFQEFSDLGVIVFLETEDFTT